MNWMRCHVIDSDVGERAGERRLAGAGHVLEQQVALGEQAHHRVVDHLGLALDDVTHVGAQACDVVRDRGMAASGGAVMRSSS